MNIFSSEIIESLANKVQKQLDIINDVKFVYRVRANDSDSPNIRETREEYAVLRSDNPTYPNRWISWKVFSKDKDENWILDRFMVYNGKNMWRYDRINPDNPGTLYKWSRGIVEPCVNPNRQTWEIVFAQFLFMNVVGYGNEVVDEYIKSLGREKWYIAANPSPDEYILEREIKAPHWKESDKYYIRAFLYLKPVPMVRRTENSSDFSKSSDKNDIDEVLEFSQLGEIYYPLKGRSVSPALSTQKHDKIYEFEIESVERLTEKDRKTWIPEWPTGTSIKDNINNKNIEIPHTKEQIDKIRDNYFAQYDGEKQMKVQTPKRILFILFFNLIGLMLIGLHFWRKYRKQKNTL
ncbi:MAG: hypothetical protein LBJ67_02990 [Planctomycetaceae bacterium]|jgi:hypothetical protein|nr:hypothetical protein [Planctomycetaceae bacterium]